MTNKKNETSKDLLKRFLKLTENLPALSIEEYEKNRERHFTSDGLQKQIWADVVVYKTKVASNDNFIKENQADQDKTFDNMNVSDKTIDQAIRYLKKWNWHSIKSKNHSSNLKVPLGVYIYGSHDASKTHLMHGFVNYISKKGLLAGKQYRLYNWSAMMKSLKDFETEANMPGEFNNSISTSLAKATEFRCKNTDLIIFDDIGSNTSTRYDLETITHIIEYRKSKKKDTFFTSNHSLNELKNILDKRIVHNILETTVSVNIKSEVKNRYEIQKKFQKEYYQEGY